METQERETVTRSSGNYAKYYANKINEILELPFGWDGCELEELLCYINASEFFRLLCASIKEEYGEDEFLRMATNIISEWERYIFFED